MAQKRARRAFPSLKAWRDDAGLSQVQAAELAGMDQAQWSRMERGQGAASPMRAKALSKLTGVPLETLLGIADTDSGVNAGR